MFARKIEIQPESVEMLTIETCSKTPKTTFWKATTQCILLHYQWWSAISIQRQADGVHPTVSME